MLNVPAPLDPLRRQASDLWAYAQGLLPGEPRSIPVLIFAQGRSGSTVLESLLASTGHFASRGELLGEGHERVRYPHAFLRGHARRTGRRSFLAHVKVYHLNRDRIAAGAAPIDPRAFLRQLHGEGWRIIHLTRQDRVRHVLSNLVAEARKEYHKLDDRPETTAVRVERAALDAAIAERLAYAEEERAALEGIPHTRVIYEEDLEPAAAHQATANRVLDFLGLPHRPVSTPLRKINARPLREIIANYDELADWLEGGGPGRSSAAAGMG